MGTPIRHEAPQTFYVEGVGEYHERRQQFNRRAAITFLSRYISSLNDFYNPESSVKIDPNIFLQQAQGFSRDAQKKGEMNLDEVRNFRELITAAQIFFDIPIERQIITGDYNIGLRPDVSGLSDQEDASARAYNQRYQQANNQKSKEMAGNIVRWNSTLRFMATEKMEAVLIIKILLAANMRINAGNADASTGINQLLSDLKLADERQLLKLDTIEKVIARYIAEKDMEEKPLVPRAA